MFAEHEPYYLVLGMPLQEYWDGDPARVKLYRKADALRRDRTNQELWLQGLYFYQAFLCASPILHAFAPKGTQPRPYPDTPVPLVQEQRTEQAAAREEMRGKSMLERFKARALVLNHKFGLKQEKRGEES